MAHIWRFFRGDVEFTLDGAAVPSLSNSHISNETLSGHMFSACQKSDNVSPFLGGMSAKTFEPLCRDKEIKDGAQISAKGIAG